MNKLMKILCCIITYNPDIERLKQNINAISNAVHDFVLIDNNSENKHEIEDLAALYYQNINVNIIKNDKNMGIGTALNQGVQYAVDSEASWILTMDQDSVFFGDSVKELINYPKDEKTGIVFPAFDDRNAQMAFQHYNRIEKFFKRCIFSIRNWWRYSMGEKMPMTSGCLLNVNAAVKAGGFDESLFIGAVDWDMNLKLMKNGYRIIKCSSAKLLQEFGKPEIKKYAGWSVIVPGYSLWRNYYMVRNDILMVRKYFTVYPSWLVLDMFRLIYSCIRILMIGPNRAAIAKFMLYGLRDSITGKRRPHEDVLKIQNNERNLKR